MSGARRFDDQGQPAEPTEIEIASLLGDAKRVAELRRRLSSISTFILGPAKAASVMASQEILGVGDTGLSVTNPATARKAWRHGFLPLNVDDYLKFLDWNARQLIPGKSGAMDDSLPPILERLGMAPAFWLKMIENFERWFHGAAGSSQKLAEEAARTARTARQWLQGIGPTRGAVG